MKEKALMMMAFTQEANSEKKDTRMKSQLKRRQRLIISQE